MKIPNTLPQFQDKNSLLVVIGHHHGKLYKALNGEVDLIDDILIEEPEYSDNEGLFKGKNSSNGYGSVLESKKSEYEKKFSKKIAEKALDYSKNNDLEQVYLFMPEEMKGLVGKDWNNNIQKIIIDNFYGNYVSEDVMTILGMIKEKRISDDYIEPEGEAKKILNKTETE